MKVSKVKCDLNTCFLCQCTLKEWHQVIHLNRKNFSYKKGEQIFKEGDEVKGIYFIYKGKVKVHKYWDAEKEFIARFAKEGDIVGHMGLGDALTYPVSATALEPTVVCYMDSAFFESTLTINTKFTYNLMRFFANELLDKDRKMRDLVHMSVKARIAQSFISLKKQFGTDKEDFIAIELTRQDLSAFAGVAYETLFKVITELSGKNIIQAIEKRYQIKDESFLHKIIEEDQHKQMLKRK